MNNIKETFAAEINIELRPNYWLFAARFPNAPLLRNYLTRLNIDAGPLWRPLNKLLMNKSFLFFSNEDVVSNVVDNSASLPSSTLLSIDEQRYIVDKIVEYCLTVK